SSTVVFFFSSRRRHTSSYGDWSSDVCSSDLRDHRTHCQVVGPTPCLGAVAIHEKELIDPVRRGREEVSTKPEHVPVSRVEARNQIGRSSCRERANRLVGAIA